jgi:hypothetical protein
MVVVNVKSEGPDLVKTIRETTILVESKLATPILIEVVEVLAVVLTVVTSTSYLFSVKMK